MARAKWYGAMAIAIVVLLFDTASAADRNDGLDSFLTTYQCSLSGLIAKILAHDKPEDQDRFIVLSLPGPLASYVRCAFEHKDRDALCEASSGWWNNPWEKPNFSAAELAALGRIGFSTDGSRGNFKREMHFPPGGPDPYALARLMLSALYEAYGAREGMRIEVEAPFALRHGFLPQQRCAMIS